MDRYTIAGVSGNQAGVLLSINSLISSTATRGRVQEMTLDAGGTPADNAIQYTVQRFTADGTGTAFTPVPHDTASPASAVTSRQTYTVEATFTANIILFQNEINQRAIFRLMISPGFEWVLNATAGNGIGFRFIHATYTSTARCTAAFSE